LARPASKRSLREGISAEKTPGKKEALDCLNLFRQSKTPSKLACRKSRLLAADFPLRASRRFVKLI
jgi:hypothetical protein